MKLVVKKKETHLQEQERILNELKNALVPIVNRELEKVKKGRKTTAHLRKIKSNIKWFHKRIEKTRKFEDKKMSDLELFLLKQGIQIEYI